MSYQSSTNALGLLRWIVSQPESLQLTEGATTHDAGLVMSAKLVAQGCDDDRVTSIVRALLPTNYSGNSLKELPGWLASARRKKFDQASNQLGQRQRPRVPERLLELFEDAGGALFHDHGKNAYASFPADGRGVLNVALRSSEAKLQLTRLLFEAEKKAVSARQLEEAINLFEAKARFSGKRHPVFLRVGGGASATSLLTLGMTTALS